MNSLLSKNELVELLKEDKSFRDSFAIEYVKNSIPNQLRALREERGWTQARMGEETNKPRNVITRLENPNSNIPNIQTMLEIAIGCDAGLLVKIVPFSKLLEESDKPLSDLFSPSISKESEIAELNQWIENENQDSVWSSKQGNKYREFDTVYGQTYQESVNTDVLQFPIRESENYSVMPSSNPQPELAGLGLTSVDNSFEPSAVPSINNTSGNYRELISSTG